MTDAAATDERAVPPALHRGALFVGIALVWGGGTWFSRGDLASAVFLGLFAGALHLALFVWSDLV